MANLDREQIEADLERLASQYEDTRYKLDLLDSGAIVPEGPGGKALRGTLLAKLAAQPTR